MAVIHMEGFDGITTAQFTDLGYSMAGSGALGTGRFASALNSKALGFTGGNTTDNFVMPLPAAKTQFVYGFAFQHTSNGAAQRVLTARNGATEAFNIVKDTNGRLTIRAGTSTTTLATGTQVLATGTYYFIEVKFNYTGAGNPTVTVRINGTADVTYTGSLNAQTQITQVVHGFSFSTVVCPSGMVIDDIYIVDFTGSDNTDFLGDCRVELMVPDSTAAVTGFAPTGAATDHEAVDDYTHDSDTTYTAGTAVGHEVDFGTTALSNEPSGIFAVAIQAVAKKTDVGTRSIQTRITSDASTAASANRTLTNSYAFTPLQIVERDPDGNVPWTRAQLEAATIGVEVTA